MAKENGKMSVLDIPKAMCDRTISSLWIFWETLEALDFKNRWSIPPKARDYIQQTLYTAYIILRGDKQRISSKISNETRVSTPYFLI